MRGVTWYICWKFRIAVFFSFITQLERTNLRTCEIARNPTKTNTTTLRILTKPKSQSATMPFVDCIRCGYSFYSSSRDGVHSRYCAYCDKPSQTAVTKYVVQKKEDNAVTGFTRKDAQHIVDSVFSQPRTSDVSAREVTFEKGRFSVREEYERR
ncbi:uncharacterized protein PAC_09226 [Phialocephala subalpina]|uniref:C2H2-type domain-containing protein n=1 Tax=Phialocephala subalpina TaxID=576137 RepID=A0A1L7X2U3_9HELO|nr:uncharacterized protein PAC_09226 [Phialocephala subalpina]